MWYSDTLGGGAAIIACITTGDINNNNKKEIIAGRYTSTIRIFENDTNNSYIKWPYIFTEYNIGFKSITTADTDKNGKEEILIIKGKTDDGYFAIFEDTTVIFEEKNNVYLAEVDAGCLDPDTFPDIIVTHGGWVEDPVYFNVYEYNDSTYEKKAISFNGYTGFLLTTAIADIDLDGKNELAVSGIFNSGDQQLWIVKSNYNDQYQIISSISFESETSPMDISIKDILYNEYPEIAVCTHSSGGLAQVFLFSYDGDSLKQIYETGDELNGNGAFYSVDLCFADQDTFPDILIGASGGKALLLEYQPVTSINDQELQYLTHSKLTLNQNSLNNIINIKYSITKNSAINLDIYNMQGKRLRSLVNGLKNAGSYDVVWDGRSDSGDMVGNGCYLIRLVSGDSEVTMRVIFTR